MEILDRSLYLLEGTAGGIFSVIIPLLEGIFACIIVVGILFLPLLIGSGIHKLIGNKVKDKISNGIMIVFIILQILWFASCLRFMWLDLVGG